MVKLGLQVSIKGSFASAVSSAQALTCDTFQIVTKAPLSWNAQPIGDADAAAFQTALKETGIGPAVVHMAFLPNPAAEKPDLYERSVAAITDELNRCAKIGAPYLVTHLGHYGKTDGHDKGLEKVIAAFSTALDNSEGNTMLLLEDTAGEGNSLGGTFTEVGTIADGIGRKDRIGFCFDTCHAGAAGYDIPKLGAEAIFDQFSDEAGALDRLKVIHLNDMKGAIGSHLDRHEHLGLGTLGEAGIRDVLTCPKVSHCAFILEIMPTEIRNEKEDLAVARRLAS